MAEIVAANDLGGNPDLIQPGKQLVIPGARAACRRGRAGPQGGEPSSAPPPSATGQPRHARVPSTRTYEVEPGDTLASIAKAFGVDVETILASNGIANPNTIKPGVELRILPVKGLEYKVGRARRRRYRVEVPGRPGLLLDYNDLDDPDIIRVGGKLIVPAGDARRCGAAPAPHRRAAPRTGRPGAGGADRRPSPPPSPVRPSKAAPRPRWLRRRRTSSPTR